jgi:hypothetical protein
LQEDFGGVGDALRNQFARCGQQELNAVSAAGTDEMSPLAIFICQPFLRPNRLLNNDSGRVGRQHFACLAEDEKQASEIVARAVRVRMFRAERIFKDQQGALIEQLCSREIE